MTLEERLQEIEKLCEGVTKYGAERSLEMSDA